MSSAILSLYRPHSWNRPRLGLRMLQSVPIYCRNHMIEHPNAMLLYKNNIVLWSSPFGITQTDWYVRHQLLSKGRQNSSAYKQKRKNLHTREINMSKP